MAEPVTYTLKEPVTLGSEVITVLTLTPSVRALKGFAMPVRDDGVVLFEPYELAAVGVRLAGQPVQVLERLGLADTAALAGIVMDFLQPALGAGSAG